ncbi:putative sugar phosphate isomerase/epimerase IoIE [Agrobacterium tumefaciens str. Kerr 14]|uniref:Putative sugar phosphate isomerase/epimerase IoIE n=1 Tax=Agrobacterium tumefaciens str. Kerr 14 TaxID=1183424 RepID=A0A1S7SA92_AGRTU|nr:TIM barrel protein [Agrobacterium tumefaciens]CUX65221.1 putative sugar phosphate isomerase/epimerase IoIE [Agrobacterium tumefaciens str. Kerr 14]
MSVKLGNAPVSWGVDYFDDPKNPPWTKVMDEIAAAGYKYAELGPYGYFPTDPDVLRAEYARRGLTPVAGFAFQVLHDPARTSEVLAIVDKTCRLLSSIGARYLNTIDHISEERMRTAGRRDLARPLQGAEFEHMIELIDRIADVALSHDVLPVIHQHAGCYIEFEDELERVLDRLEPSRLGICIDTGHMAYAGIDPVSFYESHADRVKYFHFKDIDPAVHARALQDDIPFLTAVEQNIFCPMGKGVVDWPALAVALAKTGYSNPATVEQDIDPTLSLNPLEDAKASLKYLQSVGF